MNLNLSIYRTGLNTDCTIGTLSVDGTAFCNSLEDKDRKLEESPDDKIPGETAIPRGKYQVVVTHSPHFGRDLPLLLGVEGYSGVRIHPGNQASDTDGCILVGIQGDRDNWLFNSRVTFDPLFGMIQATIDAGDEVWLTVA